MDEARHLEYQAVSTRDVCRYRNRARLAGQSSGRAIPWGIDDAGRAGADMQMGYGAGRKHAEHLTLPENAQASSYSLCVVSYCEISSEWVYGDQDIP